MRDQTLNAKITGTYIGGWDNTVPGRGGKGVLTVFVYLEWANGEVGFGGFALTAAGLNTWVRGVLDTLQVHSWEKLPGTYVRVRIEDGMAVAIAHLMEERWFEPRVDLKEATQ